MIVILLAFLDGLAWISVAHILVYGIGTMHHLCIVESLVLLAHTMSEK